MGGKFLTRDKIIDLVKSEHRTNALRQRRGLAHHPVVGFKCGCSDPTCGGFHSIVAERTIPTAAEAESALATDKAIRKASKRVQKANTARKRRRKKA